MKDVALAAGVSVTTVSLVLNDKASGIPDVTRARVLEVARNLGYRPNAMASALRRQTSDTIGFISDTIATTPHAGAMVQGAQDAAWKAGKLLLMVNTDGDADVEGRTIETLLQRQVDGIVYAAMYHHKVQVPSAVREVPAVLLDARSDDTTMSSVVPAEAAGAYSAVEHLLQAGHRRIAFAQNTDDIPATAERLEGYRQALEDWGVNFDPELVVSGESEHIGGEIVGAQIVGLTPRPTAIFCFTDRMAVGVIRAIHGVDLDVPADISVVGFDNQELVAPLIDPPITTVQLPHYEMGRWAVEHLLQLIDDPSSAQPEQYRMPCPLVTRQSVAAPRGERIDVRRSTTAVEEE